MMQAAAVNAANSATGEVLVERRGSAVIIRLNRPRALNSLTLDMVRSIRSAMDAAAGDDAVATVIMTGAGERGLCAGGDIRAIYDMGRSGDPNIARFWREEFPLNYRIAHFPKPYVALMDGIVMGGGVGISAHGRHRLVTETTRLAMPETGIGYLPDVGATWLLPKAPGETGTWLGLTGESVGAADAIHAGLADQAVAADALNDLVDALTALAPGAGDGEVDETIRRFAINPPAGRLSAHRSVIDAAFGFDRVEDIIAALERHADAFAEETRQVLMKRSPTSLKLTLRLLRLGRSSSSLVECLEREYVAACAVLNHVDFYEGVRAAIIDKDRNPRWQPASLAEVDEAAVDAYFAPARSPLFADHRL